MWYWILIHLWHEPEHILVIIIQFMKITVSISNVSDQQGDFPYPDPSKWTNQELGISD